MQYKTIVLNLLRQRREFHYQLKSSRTLPETLDRYAEELKTSHETWKEQLGQERPGSDPSQITSEALEVAIKELEDRLPPEFPTDENEPLSLDGAMAYIRKYKPPA